MKRMSLLARLGSVLTLGVGLMTPAVHADPVDPRGMARHIDHFWLGPDTEQWVITMPDVKRGYLNFDQIPFSPGDLVTITAGGCYQRGGSGKTWVRYVDPRAPRDLGWNLHGLVEIPGITPGLIPIKFINGHPQFIPENASPFGLYLRLGLLDSNYGDNGYWGRSGDDGWMGQCRGEPNAYVVVTVRHP